MPSTFSNLQSCISVKKTVSCDYENAAEGGEKQGGHIMEIKYNIEKSERKAMAHKIGELLKEDVRYLGAPTFAYEIAFFTLDKNGVLSFSDRSDTELVEQVLDGLDYAGYEPEERPAPQTPEQTEESDKPVTLTLTMPKSFFTYEALENLHRIVNNKARLLKHALDASFLDIDETDDDIEFPWFTVEQSEDEEAYKQFVTMLCEFAKKQKRVNNKPDTSDNEKYAFRCFLLRIGMIGAEYKTARKVLLRRLTGSAAFRSAKAQEA